MSGIIDRRKHAVLSNPACRYSNSEDGQHDVSRRYYVFQVAVIFLVDKNQGSYKPSFCEGNECRFSLTGFDPSIISPPCVS